MKIFYILSFTFLFSTQLSAQTFTDSNLPIVIINTDINSDTSEPNEILDEPKIPASMKIIYHTDGSRNFLTDQNNPEFLDYDGRIGIELRGSTSQLLPKKPYGFDTKEIDDISNNNVEILGMPKENDWVLNSLAFDKSLIRDYLSYDLARNMGNYSARGRYCEVVINGDYKGLYIIMEKLKVDSDRINIAKIDETDNVFPEITGGYFTKCDKVDPDETVAWSYPTATGNPARFIHAKPEQEDITTEQNNYIKSVFDDLLSTADAQNASIINGYPSIIDVPSFVDFILVNELASNVDAYQFSTFFHKDRGGKLRAGPIWDFNFSYGSDTRFNRHRSRFDVWQFDNIDNVGPSFWKDLFDNQLFNCYLSKRWEDLTATGEILNYSTIEAEIDNLGNLLAEAKDREQARWGTLTGYEQDIIDFKTWLQERFTWMDANLGGTSNCLFPVMPDLVISQINYNPDSIGVYDDDDLEFIGLTNNSNDTVTLTGFYLSALGISYQFPENSTLAPGELIYLVSNESAFEEYYGLTAYGEFNRNMSNKSQELTLSDAFGNTIDTVTYLDESPWPPQADGLGPYLILNDLNSDNSDAVNWSITTVPSLGLENIVSQTKVYPNPTNDIVFLENKNSQIKAIKVFDLMGRMVSEVNTNSKKVALNLKEHSSNVYLLKITFLDGSSTFKKIVKQ